jgi:hypothetical protein
MLAAMAMTTNNFSFVVPFMQFLPCNLPDLHANGIRYFQR